ncbi:Com family DNA-binding transcriptional regulator [Candidatus Saccharibacteria bacterium]|nr:Com family DNA-binding transcriptional regulator [Candidatus Saccharibacteria bacterium]
MLAVSLNDRRCEKCNKLLFKGLLGMGVLEVKCPRCGNINLLHSFDMLIGKNQDRYVLAFMPTGKIIAASDSASTILGYERNELQELSFSHIDTESKLPAIGNARTPENLEAWSRYTDSLPNHSYHHHKNGRRLYVSVRVYPLGSLDGPYAVGVFSLRHDLSSQLFNAGTTAGVVASTVSLGLGL